MKSQAEKPSLECAYCDKKFKYDSERKRHERSHCPQFSCKVCAKKFSFISALRRHEKQHERTGSVTCSECNRKFRDEALLQRHINYAHKGSFECPKCQVIFSSDLALRCHLKTHKPEAERSFHCRFDGCTKKFNFAHHLKHHELTHTNTKQHFCKECGKGFIQHHHLKSHIKIHEPERWKICTLPGCKKKFATTYALKKHVASHKILSSNEDTSDMKPLTDNNHIYDDAERVINCHSTQPIRIEEINDERISFDYKSLSDINELIKSDTISVEKHIPFSELEKESHNDGNSLTCIKDKEPELTKLDLVKLNLDDDISTCKSYLGGCIVGEDDNNDGKCLCAQISGPADREPVEITWNMDDDCGSCECGSNSKRKDNNNSTNKIVSECEVSKPEMVYESNGTIKIKETFDFDINIPTYSCKTKGKDDTCDRIPFNSCKDVLGGCIVSGNGTIGEGCLCARMAVDDQQMIDQEIDELTPRPMVR